MYAYYLETNNPSLFNTGKITSLPQKSKIKAGHKTQEHSSFAPVITLELSTQAPKTEQETSV